MTSVYEVTTRHDRQMLKDFLTFRREVKKDSTIFRLIAMGIVAAVLAFSGRGRTLTYVCGVLAVLLLLLAAVWKRLELNGLAKKDLSYQKQCEIKFTFGENSFRVDNPENGGEQRIRYAEVPYMYQDKNYYYISVNNDDLHMFAKSDFTLGNAEDFADFMERKTEKEFQPVKLPWKTRLFLLKHRLAQQMTENEQKK